MKKKSIAAIKRVLKHDKSGMKWAHVLHNAPGVGCIACNGYSAFRLQEDAPEVEHAPEGVTLPGDVSRFFPDVSRMHAAALPSLEELKAARNANRGKSGRDWRPVFFLDYIAFNPQYIIDALEILENPVLYLPDAYNKACYIQGSNGDALIMPVHHSGEKRYYRETEAATAAA